MSMLRRLSDVFRGGAGSHGNSNSGGDADDVSPVKVGLVVGRAARDCECPSATLTMMTATTTTTTTTTTR
jgi:hypothetical protein